MKRYSFLIFLLLFSLANSPGYCQNPPARKGPEPDAKVLFIFVDSLRPDIVDEMVAQGRLPNIKKLFYDQGLRFPNFFSTFPSLTVNAFGSLLTGKTQDQSGLKAQSLFERFPVRKKNLAKRIFFVPEDYPRFFNMLTKVEKAPQVLRQNKAKTFYDLLGEKYNASVVPISPSVAPWGWPHIAANDVDRPHRVVTEAVNKLDDLNGKYALRYMVPDTRAKLLMIWFTEMDEEQHRHDGGQWDPEVQKEMDNVDRWLGKIYDGIIREDDGRTPYVILFSDHGSYGGKNGVYNQPYYLGRELFFKTLKMNVRGPDYVMTHPGTDVESYAYIDNMGRGQARIFLPIGDSLSEKWDRPNTLYELEHYGRGPNRTRVNLIQELLNINLEAQNRFPAQVDPYPVDLAFVKLSEELIYVIRQGGAEALIQIEHKDGKPRYLYRPVQNVHQDQSGKLTYNESFTTDPFGYLTHPKFHSSDPLKFIGEYHNDQEWLDASYETDYPDAIPAIAHALMWKPELAHLAKSQDPDLWISATPGWNFRIENINGADHGAILKDAMRCTLMFSGPNIRKGVDPAPHRLIDVTPTLLQLLSYRGVTELNSVPIEGLYEV